MIEANDDGNYLVRVRAQVMTRDDSTGGWVPMGGGGLSNVSVRKRVSLTEADDRKQEYQIYGKRMCDENIVLSCTIKKDFEYNKVMPTFHHWKTGDKKFGLTFQTAADARSFDKGVRLAVQDLLDDGCCDSSFYYGKYSDVDDDVFMTLNLPVEREDSASSSASVTTCNSSRHTPTSPLSTPDHPLPLHPHHLHRTHCRGAATPSPIPPTTHTSPASTGSFTVTTVGIPPSVYPNPHSHLHRITFLPPKPPRPPSNTPDKMSDHRKGSPDSPSECIEVIGDTYSYVQFSPKEAPPINHDYSYPMMGPKGGGGGGMERRDSLASLKKHQHLELISCSQPTTQTTAFPLGNKRIRKQRDRRAHKNASAKRCRHCQEMFAENTNMPGTCEFAPDPVRAAVRTLSCLPCAQCMLYHCMSDAEGDFAPHPCECGGPGGVTDRACGRRWVGLALLSLFVPCLWCYLPMRACHRCGVACGVCGGRHET